MTNEEIIALNREYVFFTWAVQSQVNPIPAVRSEGVYFWDADGKQYLDHNRFHDNLFCLFPEKTVEFVERATVPVMGYKILAAGAIKPEDGFHWAFKNGADFICVGMFDFQLVNDINVTIDTLKNLQGRTRAWYA